jgi:hypothetical protein
MASPTPICVDRKPSPPTLGDVKLQRGTTSSKIMTQSEVSIKSATIKIKRRYCQNDT